LLKKAYWSTITVKCRIAIQLLFLYLILCLSVMLDSLLCSFTYISFLTVWVTPQVSYKNQELLTLREHLSTPPVFWWGSVLLIILVFCVVLLCVFTFLVACYDVRYDIHKKTMFRSSLPPVVCMRADVLFTLFVFTCI
jgi:membrane protein YdbS with pleckstrin-like domain